MAAFYNLADARVKLAEYRRYDKEERPHSSLGDAAPAAFAARASHSRHRVSNCEWPTGWGQTTSTYGFRSADQACESRSFSR